MGAEDDLPAVPGQVLAAPIPCHVQAIAVPGLPDPRQVSDPIVTAGRHDGAEIDGIRGVSMVPAELTDEEWDLSSREPFDDVDDQARVVPDVSVHVE